MSESGSPIKVRPSGVLLQGDRVLLIKQSVTAKRKWSLPGGRLEKGETIEHCLVRELKEETGIDVGVLNLLYVTDRFSRTDHVVHMMFLIRSLDPNLLPLEWTHEDPHSSGSSETLREIRMVPCKELESYGFGATFGQLVRDGFPDLGSYKGDFETFYGEP
jgi:ADP-ribose pyrophosphatase YjhB (NUDIX family)